MTPIAKNLRSWVIHKIYDLELYTVIPVCWTSILIFSMFVWQRLVIGPNKPTPFAVLAVRRDKPLKQNMAVTLRARNSVNAFTIKVILFLDLVTSWKAIA